jgi:hypothetical protein
MSVFLTPKIVVSVSKGPGIGFSDTDTDIKTFFLSFERKKNANKVGFKVKKYLQHLKTLVSVPVSHFPRPKIVVSVSVSEKPTSKNVGVGFHHSIECYKLA